MRFRIVLCLAAMHFAAVQCLAQLELQDNRPGWVADARAIYVFHAEISHDPAFGVLSGPTLDRSKWRLPDPNVNGTSHNLSAESTALYGPGFRISLLNQSCDGWFCGGIYESLFIDNYRQAGVQTGSYQTGDNDNIHASLVNLTLADNNAMNDDFDAGLVDFASERADLDKHTVDIIFGRRTMVSSHLTAFWKAGLRGAFRYVERNVFYYNVEGSIQTPPGGGVDDIDTANIDLDSKMWSAGPIVGAGGTWKFGTRWLLSADVALAALYADFTVRRFDRYVDSSLDRLAYSNIQVESSGFVPMMDCSVELAAQLTRRWSCAVGYTAAASLGGARSISIPGWDDVDDETQPYTIERDDIISHALYVRTCFLLGP